jgi:hypothetical protein
MGMNHHPPVVKLVIFYRRSEGADENNPQNINNQEDSFQELVVLDPNILNVPFCLTNYSNPVAAEF